MIDSSRTSTAFRRPLPLIVGVLFFWLITVAVTVATLRTSLLWALLMLGPLLPLTLGGVLVYVAWPRREGWSAHCAACGYRQAPTGINSSNCPECGSDWTKRDSTVRGRVIRRSVLLALGALLLGLAAIMLMENPLPLRGWRAALIPTSLLVNDAIHGNFSPSSAWTALNKRTLTEAQRIRVAEGLLDRRRRSGRIIEDQALQWLNSMIHDGLLPDRIVNRFHREMIDIWIISPNEVRVGENFNATIGAKVYATCPAEVGMTIYVAGYSLRGDENQRARQSSAIPMRRLGEKRSMPFDHEVSPDISPRATFTANEPGEMTIELALWLVVVPRAGVTDEIVWLEDGRRRFLRKQCGTSASSLSRSCGLLNDGRSLRRHISLRAVADPFNVQDATADDRNRRIDFALGAGAA